MIAKSCIHSYYFSEVFKRLSDLRGEAKVLVCVCLVVCQKGFLLADQELLEAGKIILVGKGKPDSRLSFELVIVREHFIKGFFFGHFVNAHSLIFQEISLRKFPFGWLCVKLLLFPQQIFLVTEIRFELSLMPAIKCKKLIPIFCSIFYVAFIEVE